jgi:multisubunit Na+/H+ antiporter MnhG subunit
MYVDTLRDQAVLTVLEAALRAAGTLAILLHHSVYSRWHEPDAP